VRPAGVFDEDYHGSIATVRTRFQWVVLLAGLAALFLFPLSPWASSYWLGLLNFIAITAIVVLGLQIVTGYCGQVSLGQAAIMGVGAYTSAVLTTKLGLSFWLALPLSGLTAGVVGVLVGAPSLRVKGFYLALATLAAHFIIIWLMSHLNFTGETRGLVMAAPQIGGFSLRGDFRMFYLIMAVLVLMTFFAKNLARTRIGRAFVAIRDNDIAAEVMGINVWRYKMLAFFIACVYAGIGGSLWAGWVQSVNFEQFPLWNEIWYVAMIIIGGVSSISGVFFGVIFLKLLDELVLFAAPVLGEAFPFLGGAQYALGLSAFGLVLILFLLFEPRGLAHRWELLKASVRLYPFPY